MIAISVDRLESGMKVGRNIYGSNGQILLAAGVTLNDNFIERLRQLEIMSIYITNEIIGEVEIDEVISEQTRVSAIKHTKEMMSNIKLGSSLDSKQVNKVVNDIIDELLNNSNNVINLLDIRAHDDYIFAHSVNVAVLSIIVGISLRYDQIKLRNLAAGALFHDIGKVMLSQELLKKGSNLEGEDLEVFNKHTNYGFDILRKKEEFSLFSAHVAFQHHEHFDGQGFPSGLKGEDIHEFARIVAVADIYDNLTNNGVGLKQVYPHEAVEYIIANSGHAFDPDIVKIFVKCIALFPIGCVVLLNTGEIAFVIKDHKGLPTRPIVRVIKDYQGNSLKPGYDINLEHKTTYFIVKVLDNEVLF